MHLRKRFKSKFKTQLTTLCKLMTDQSLIIVFQYYNRNCDNLQREFPGDHGGVSSAIVLGGKFQVYVGTNGDGVSSILEKGSYSTPPEMQVANDAIKSIRKLN